MTDYMEFLKKPIKCRSCASTFSGRAFDADCAGWSWSRDEQGWYWLCPSCHIVHMTKIKNTIPNIKDTWGT